MNKDLWVISEFEDIKEYAAYTVRLKVKFKNDQEGELHQVVIAEDRYKLLEEEFKQECKEIAERFFAELFYVASIHHSDVANILAWAKDKATKLGINIKGI